MKSGAAALGIRLSVSQIAVFEIYYRELIDWNQRINLTAITDYEEVQAKHFLDSLTAVLAADFNNQTVIDVGTGAGFPGLPLKIAFPHIRLTLLESTEKKTSFLNGLTKKLGLNDVEILTGRAEEFGRAEQYRERFDIVISRAVAALPVLVELCLPFAVMGGMFIAYKKGDISDEVAKAQNAVGILGGETPRLKSVANELLNDGRCLVKIKKIHPTPQQYPRRAGMPGKRPLL